MTKPKGPLRRLLGSLALMLGMTCGSAALVEAQDLRLPLEDGKPDLALFVLAQSGESISDAGWQLLRLQGFLHKDGKGRFQPLSSGQNLRPTLRHDPNVNDGIPSDYITLGGLRFRLDEDARAKSALLPGLQYTRWNAWSYARGARLRLVHSYAVELEPTYGYHQANANAQLCAEQPAANWTWLDACLSAGAWHDGIATDFILHSRLGARKILDAPWGAQQIGVSLGQPIASGDNKTVLQFDTTVLTNEYGMWNIAVAWGERVENDNTLRRRIGVEWSGPVFGRNITLGLSETRTDGAALFGIPRADRRTRLNMIVPVGKLDLGAHVERTESSIDAYRGTSFGLDVRFRMNLL